MLSAQQPLFLFGKRMLQLTVALARSESTQQRYGRQHKFMHIRREYIEKSRAASARSVLSCRQKTPPLPSSLAQPLCPRDGGLNAAFCFPPAVSAGGGGRRGGGFTPSERNQTQQICLPR